ncbi:MAG: hypothetical protein GY754_45800 [bacterium]|nr:hypothetical protein [bacterium]
MLLNCKKEALRILQGLEHEDINIKLEAITLMANLPSLPDDEESKSLKAYKEIKALYKQLYTGSARFIMDVLGSDFSYGSNDAENSFNFTEAEEPIIAAKGMCYLPNAYIGGPIRAAVESPNKTVKEIALQFYDSLPSDLKYSRIITDGVRTKIRAIRAGG